MNTNILPLADKANGAELQIYSPPQARRADGPTDARQRTLWLLDLLELRQPAGACTRAKRLQLQSRQDERKRQAAALSCRCWSCRVCADRLRRSAGLHYGERLLAYAGPAYASRSRPGRWAADLKALSRAKASWVRVLGPDGGSVVIGTVALADGVAVSPAEAVRALGAALRAVRRPKLEAGKVYRPVSSSADWKPPRRDPAKWKARGRLKPRNADAVLQVLARFGVFGEVGQVAGVDGLWSVFFETPADWTPEQNRELEDELSALVGLKDQIPIQTSADNSESNSTEGPRQAGLNTRGGTVVYTINLEEVEAFLDGTSNEDVLRTGLAILEGRMLDLQAARSGESPQSLRPHVLVADEKS